MATRPRTKASVLRVRLRADIPFDDLLEESALLAYPFEWARVGDAPARSPLAEMPSASTFELVLPPEAVRVVALRVPTAKPALVRRALPGLIEDLVIGDSTDCHAVVLPGLRDDGQRDVAIVDRRWMRIAQRMARLRRPKRALVVSQSWLAQEVAGRGPFVSVEGTSGFVCHPNGVLPFTTKSPETLPSELRLAKPYFGTGPVPIAGVSAPLAEHWSGELGVPLEPVTWTWWSAASLDPSWSLLTDEYARGASTGAADVRLWGLPIGLAAACVIVAILGLNLHWWTLARERDALAAQTEQTFREAFPNEAMVVDPLAQARRLVAANGSGDEPYLTLTEALASAIDPGTPVPSVKSVEWRAQTLRAKLAPTIDAGKVARALEARGYEVIRDAPASDGAQPIVVRKRGAR